jgi:4'-phosphopantetheinyl transferase
MTNNVRSVSEQSIRLLGLMHEHDIGVDVLAVLDAEERARSSRFARAEDRNAFITTRVALRYALSAAIKVPPGDIKLAFTSAGKPLLSPAHAHDDLHFSVSHAGSYSVIALSRRGPIGVDIEQRRSVPDRIRIASRLFGEAVARQIAMRPTEQQDAAFLRLWTAAEAYAKATGQGLAGVDQWLPVSAAIDKVAAPEAGGAIRGTTRWSLLPFMPPVDYVGSIAIERADTALHRSPLPEMTNLFVLSVAGCW